MAQKTELLLTTDQLPKHVGIIMDGNGRWAKKRGLPRNLGHKAGAKTFEKIARYCKKIGIPYVTFYAFSTENWRRPKEEVDGIMNLLGEYLKRAYSSQQDEMRTQFIGDREPLRQDLKEMMADIEEKTKDYLGTTVNIALNYGGRDELVRAVRHIAQETSQGKVSMSEITEQLISDHLYTRGQPDPDLIIRPSGEQRSSNFLTWQSAYAEYVFMDVLWPDFGESEFNEALNEYGRRSRRFGGI